MIKKIIQSIKKALSGKEDTPARQATPSGKTIKAVSVPDKKPSGKPKPPVQKTTKRRPPQKKWNPSDFEVAPVEGKTRFHDLGLPDRIMHAISDLGFTHCTPIQAEIMPSTLKGRDAFGRAQTGTGKTAAFLITVLTMMLKNPLKKRPENGTPRVLIIAPTRELVLQIAEEAVQLSKYTPLSIVTVFGGMDYEKQRRRLNGKRVDIIVATPGRLLDFKRRKDLNLKKVEVLIIDEADRMLDMGFIPDVRNIVYSTPHKDKRQTMLFSATLTPEVTRLSSSWTRDPVSVEIEPEQVAVDTVNQVVYIVTTDQKFDLTYNIITKQNLNQTLVFCNRRDETRKLAQMLSDRSINCAVLSGEVPQNKRIRTLNDFKNGKIRVLVATDVAGRGIHIEGMDHVINFALPHDPEDYVHRIGRTGRAGTIGTSISFACEDDSFYIPAIEAFTGKPLHCIQPDEALLEKPPAPKRSAKKPGRRYQGKAPAKKRRYPSKRTGGKKRRYTPRPKSNRQGTKKTEKET